MGPTCSRRHQREDSSVREDENRIQVLESTRQTPLGSTVTSSGLFGGSLLQLQLLDANRTIAEGEFAFRNYMAEATRRIEQLQRDLITEREKTQREREEVYDEVDRLKATVADFERVRCQQAEELDRSKRITEHLRQELGRNATILQEIQTLKDNQAEQQAIIESKERQISLLESQLSAARQTIKETQQEHLRVARDKIQLQFQLDKAEDLLKRRESQEFYSPNSCESPSPRSKPSSYHSEPFAGSRPCIARGVGTWSGAQCRPVTAVLRAESSRSGEVSGLDTEGSGIQGPESYS